MERETNFGGTPSFRYTLLIHYSTPGGYTLLIHYSTPGGYTLLIHYSTPAEGGIKIIFQTF